MAKKTHVKVRLVPESKPDSPFNYYVKKPSSGEKASRGGKPGTNSSQWTGPRGPQPLE